MPSSPKLRPIRQAIPGLAGLGNLSAPLQAIADFLEIAVTDLILSGTLIRHPGMRIIVPHGGGALPLLADRIKAFLLASPPQVPTPDPVANLARLYYDLAGTPFPRQVPALLGLAGPGHLLYGSDFCFTPAAGIEMQIASINAAPVPAGGATWQSLTTANALGLLPRLAPPSTASSGT